MNDINGKSQVKLIRIPDEFKGYDLNHFVIPSHYQNDLSTVLIPNGVIQDRIEKIALDIFREFNGEPMTIVCILKGAYQFNSDLMDKLKQLNDGAKNKSIKIDVEFLRLKSYENDKSVGKIQMIGGELLDLKDKNVLIVEDIVDTGSTMLELFKQISKQYPKRVKLASLLVKRTPHVLHHIDIDYCGFEIPDKFIVGYGLDYNENFRDLKHICCISQNGINKYSTTD